MALRRLASGAAGFPLILALVFIAYWPALRGEFLWDDIPYFAANRFMRTANGLWRIWTSGAIGDYWPLNYTTFWAEFHIWGLRPSRAHMINAALHASAAFFLWKAADALSLRGAYAAALLFALHPANVGAVAAIAQRKTILAGLFFFASVLAWLRFERGSWRWYFLSLLLFVCAILSKTSALMLPPTLLLIGWWRTGRLTLRTARAVAPFFLLSVVAAVIGSRLQSDTLGSASDPRAHLVVEMDVPSRLANMGHVFWFYIKQSLMPLEHVLIYPPWAVKTSEAWFWAPAAGMLLLAIVCLGLRRTRFAVLAAAMALYALNLIPVLGLAVFQFQFLAWVAGHLQYISLAALCAVAAHGLAGWRFGNWAGGILLCGYGLISWVNAGQYRSAEDLFRHNAEAYPEFPVALRHYALALNAKGRFPEALAVLERARELDPRHFATPLTMAESYRGLRLQAEAGQALEEAMRLSSYDPKMVATYAQFLIEAKQLEKAKAALDTAVSNFPRDPALWNNLGSIAAKSGDWTVAGSHFEKAASLDPEMAPALTNLGAVRMRQGRYVAARELADRAIAAEPLYAEARLFSARLHEAEGNYREALLDAEEAFQLAPESPDAIIALARLLASALAGEQRDLARARSLQELARRKVGDADPRVRELMNAIP